MILITDTNLIFSALLKPKSRIAQIFKAKSNLQFFAPDYLFIEIKKHWKDIIKLSDLSEKELRIELDFYLDRIKSYEVRDISREILTKSEKIVEDIDINDVFFVALHFHTGHKIWTGDKVLIKGLKSKGYDICITTEELKQNLYKKSSD